VTGRWASADSNVIAGLNRYAYVSNNPLKFVDPTGHVEEPAGEEPPEGQALEKYLTKETHVRPQHFAGYLQDPANKAEETFIATLPDATDYVNQALTARGFEPVSANEIAAAYLYEGGAAMLNDDRILVDSFGSMGLDTLMTNREALGPFLAPDLRDHLANPKNKQFGFPNERGEKVIPVDLSIEQSVEAAAAIYAWTSAQLQTHLRSQGESILQLPDYGRVYWTYMGFNGGVGTMKANLAQRGLYDFFQPWNGPDDFRTQHRAIRYNALKTMDSYLYINELHH
jgi:hypothetical protein